MAQIIDKPINHIAIDHAKAHPPENLPIEENDFSIPMQSGSDHFYNLHPEHFMKKPTELAQADFQMNEKAYQTILSNTPTILFSTNNNGIVTIAEGRGLQALGR